MYRIQAEELEKGKDHEKAAAYHSKCLTASKAAMDRHAEGMANYRLGRATVTVNKAHEALSHLDNYVSDDDRSTHTRDREKQTKHHTCTQTDRQTSCRIRMWSNVKLVKLARSSTLLAVMGCPSLFLRLLLQFSNNTHLYSS